MPNKLLNNEIIGQINQLFDSQLHNSVELIYFSRERDCDSCAEIDQLLDEVCALSDKIQLTRFDLDKNATFAQKYNVKHAPTLVVAGLEDDHTVLDFGVRLIGTPSGYEFSSLIQAIVLVSKRDSGLKATTREQLSLLREPVHLQVFVTPT